MYSGCESSTLRPVIVLLHYRIASGVVPPRSRHRSQVYGGRLTWHINCYLPRWIELAREQMRRAVTWQCFWQSPYIPRHLALFFVHGASCCFLWWSCLTFSTSAALSCLHAYMCVCVHRAIRQFFSFQLHVRLGYYWVHTKKTCTYHTIWQVHIKLCSWAISTT